MAEVQGSEEDGSGEVAPAAGVPAAAAPSGDVVSATLAFLARSLVEHVDDVRVEITSNERGPLYRLHVHGDDMGRVIGKSGRIARAIRQVSRAAAARAGTRAFIEFAE